MLYPGDLLEANSIEEDYGKGEYENYEGDSTEPEAAELNSNDTYDENVRFPPKQKCSIFQDSFH